MPVGLTDSDGDDAGSISADAMDIRRGRQRASDRHAELELPVEGEGSGATRRAAAVTRFVTRTPVNKVADGDRGASTERLLLVEAV